MTGLPDIQTGCGHCRILPKSPGRGGFKPQDDFHSAIIGALS